MKKMFKNVVMIVCLLSVLSSGISVFAAGYDVIIEPQIDYIDGKTNGVFGGVIDETETFFCPTPFFKGYSVVHNNMIVQGGFEAYYHDKNSYVVDSYGNKIDVGTYDCLGVYSLNVNPFSSDGTGYVYGYEEYNNRPAFTLHCGVDGLGNITVCKNGKIGLIDTQGNVIIPCEYDDLYNDAYDLYGVDYEKTFIEGEEEYSGKYFRASYSPYDYYFGEYPCNYYYNGLAVVADSYGENAKVGIVDTNDNIVVPFVYDMITPCYDKVCWVLKDGKWGIINVDNQTVTVKVDNEDVVFDQIPLIINGRTLAPLRAIFEKLGATVEWNGETQTITSTKGDTVITMTINMNEMYKNGEMIWLDEAPQIVGERTLVPVRAIAEALDCNVVWDGENHTVNITK